MSLLPIAPSYAASLLEVHWAAQLPAAASRLLTPALDYSHTNLLVSGERLQGRELPGSRRASLVPESLTLRLGDASLNLVGLTMDDGLTWLNAELGAELRLLEHDLPARPLDKRFELYGAEAQVQDWFVAAQRVLGAIAEVHSGSEVRLWPHHFDIATLMELDAGTDESARSINVGLSAGDIAYTEPYWYVTPWPRPCGALPALAVGHWHTGGFLAAVLPASEDGGDSPESFLAESLTACMSLLEA